MKKQKNPAVAVKVSVIVPVYNTEKYLDECLHSILHQTLKEIEVICVDDGSTDGSLKILSQYARIDSRLRVLRQENKGAGAARNLGLGEARGEYLAFLDSDDYFEAEMLEEMYRKAGLTGADIVHCDANLLDNKTGLITPSPWNLNREFLPPQETFSYRDIPHHIFVFSTGTVWDKIFKAAFIREKKLSLQEITNCNDTAFSYLSLALADKIAIVPKRFITYRQNNESSLVGQRNTHWDCFYNALKHIREALKEHGRLDILRMAFANTAISVAFWSLDKRKEPIQSIGYCHFFRHMLPDLADVIPPDKKKYLRQRERSCLSATLAQFSEYAPEKIIPVVYSARNQDVPYLGVSIQSISRQTPPEYFNDIYILHRGITPMNVRRLEGLTRDNRRVCCIDISSALAPHDAPEAGNFFCLAPLFICRYSKIICLTPYVLAGENIAPLLGHDLNGRTLAGVPLFATLKEKKYIAANGFFSTYLDTAVLLADMERLAARADLMPPLDRMQINAAFKDDFSLLDGRWNVPAKLLDTDSLKNYDAADVRTRLAHYLAGSRFISFETPKQLNKQNDATALWGRCAQESVFYEELIYAGAGKQS